jgi:putative SOS response-associated peptidase YedK
MCNLYHVTPKGDVERYIGAHGLRAEVEDFDARTVGPYQSGLILRPGMDAQSLQGRMAQWGLIRPGSKLRKPKPAEIRTNNARIESIAQRVTYADAWRQGQRCLIPASWYQEPNWETGKNVWWQLQRADGLPWWLAGLWSEWADPDTGEIVPNFTMITCNCDGHPLLARLHKPDAKLPPDQQDKRAVVHIEPADWPAWLHGSSADALALVKPTAAELFDQADAVKTDQLLRHAPETGSLF